MKISNARTKRSTSDIIHLPSKPRSIVERNIEGITSFDYSGSPNLAVYSDNYNMNNTFQANKKFYDSKEEKERLWKYAVPIYQKKEGSGKEIDHYSPIHFSNMRLALKKRYALNRSTAIEDKINQSIESKQEIPINNRYGEQTQMMNRTNFYVSDEFKQLNVNKNILPQTNIKHVSAMSDLSPEWCRKSMNYFSRSFKEGRVLGSCYGQFEIIKRQEEQGTRKSFNRQSEIVQETYRRKDRTNVSEIKRDTLHMNWNVSDNEKSFRVTGKIGIAMDNSFSRTNEGNKKQVAEKIGHSLPFKLPKANPTLLKIGHNIAMDTFSVV